MRESPRARPFLGSRPAGQVCQHVRVTQATVPLRAERPAGAPHFLGDEMQAQGWTVLNANVVFRKQGEINGNGERARILACLELFKPVGPHAVPLFESYVADLRRFPAFLPGVSALMFLLNTNVYGSAGSPLQQVEGNHLANRQASDVVLDHRAKVKRNVRAIFSANQTRTMFAAQSPNPARHDMIPLPVQIGCGVTAGIGWAFVGEA